MVRRDGADSGGASRVAATLIACAQSMQVFGLMGERDALARGGVGAPRVFCSVGRLYSHCGNVWFELRQTAICVR